MLVTAATTRLNLLQQAIGSQGRVAELVSWCFTKLSLTFWTRITWWRDMWRSAFAELFNLKIRMAAWLACESSTHPANFGLGAWRKRGATSYIYPFAGAQDVHNWADVPTFRDSYETVAGSINLV